MVKNIQIAIDGKILEGIIYIPSSHPIAWVVFSHGSGSSHLSPRNREVAKTLYDHQFGTLLFDLLDPEEDTILENRFNIELLTKRLISVTNWLMKSDHYTTQTPIGFFGASTGAAATLQAAVVAPKNWPLYAAVSRGGRVDLAKIHYLRQISIPVLLIVGEKDYEVIRLNMMAQNEIPNSDMVFIHQAGHLFEEPGSLEKMIQESLHWFEKNLPLKLMAEVH